LTYLVCITLLRTEISVSLSTDMRLLHASKLELTYFIADDEIPPYAILSHTWGEGEVSLQEWQTLSSSNLSLKTGYSKIKLCCEQAQRDGLEWAWIDA